ncbi:tetratricopeptide repeat protein [Spongiivirga sp. MCCC 1A20706]|uniref:tetratricopeptide repeat protein n=1 Tax=Spongiivirga sp. MCCC 1A20706 TaxID=3160963 RepID=UPI0039773D59
MKIKLIIILSAFLFTFSFGQNREIDSLLSVIKTSQVKKERASAFQRLAWLHILKDVDQALLYLDSAASIYTMLSDKKGISNVNYKYGVINRFQGNHNEALLYLSKFMEYSTANEDLRGQANGNYQIGIVHSQLGNYQKAIEAYFKTLKIYENDKDSTGIAFTLNDIGIVYKNLNQFEEAKVTYNRAIEIQKKKNDINNLSTTYVNLGNIYSINKEFDKAIFYYQESKTIDSILNNEYGVAKSDQSIGEVLLEKGNDEDAYEYLLNAAQIQKKNGYKIDLAETYVKIGLLLLNQEKYRESEKYFNNALALKSKSIKSNYEIQLGLYELTKKRGDFEKSLQHYTNFITYKDSLTRDEQFKTINEIRIKYETEKKDKEIAEQDLALQKGKSQATILTIIAISSLFGVILIWFSFRQRQKRKNQEILALKREHQVKTLESLIEGEEKERTRIAKELHDGVNGDLSAIKFKLSSLIHTNNTTIEEAMTMIDKSCEQVRAISHNLIPPSLEDFNLIEALDNFTQKVNDLHAINISFFHIGEMIEISKKSELNIFRIVQELVGNSIKHSGGSEINVQLSTINEMIQISVEDDGKGFDTSNKQNSGIGLQNIQSRIDYLGAAIDVDSSKEGTSYLIEIQKKELDDH